jgi:hypothetical protein
MAGRKPHEIYVYDINGKYLFMFESMAKFREVYYPDDVSPRPLFVHTEIGYKYHYMKDLDLIAFEDRSVGRDNIKYIIAIHNSEYCKKEDVDNIIQVYNLKNELIAEFKNLRLLSKLMPHLHISSVSRQLSVKNRIYKKQKHTSLGIYFKYKENESAV